MGGNKNNTCKLIGSTVDRGSTCGPSQFFWIKNFRIISAHSINLCNKTRNYRVHLGHSCLGKTRTFGCYCDLSYTSCSICSWTSSRALNVLIIPSFLKLSISFKYSCNRSYFLVFYYFKDSVLVIVLYFPFFALNLFTFNLFVLPFYKFSSSIHHPRSAVPFC